MLFVIMKKRALAILGILILIAVANGLIAQGECTQRWICTRWSSCNYDDTQVRNCIDINNCGNETNKPSMKQACGTSCETNWQCTEWQPKECPDDKTQKRTCEDLSNCMDISSKPSELRACMDISDFRWIITMVVLAVLILIVAVVILLRQRIRRRR